MIIIIIYLAIANMAIIFLILITFARLLFK